MEIPSSQTKHVYSKTKQHKKQKVKQSEIYLKETREKTYLNEKKQREKQRMKQRRKVEKTKEAYRDINETMNKA